MKKLIIAAALAATSVAAFADVIDAMADYINRVRICANGIKGVVGGVQGCLVEDSKGKFMVFENGAMYSRNPDGTWKMDGPPMWTMTSERNTRSVGSQAELRWRQQVETQNAWSAWAGGGK